MGCCLRITWIELMSIALLKPLPQCHRHEANAHADIDQLRCERLFALLSLQHSDETYSYDLLMLLSINWNGEHGKGGVTKSSFGGCGRETSASIQG